MSRTNDVFAAAYSAGSSSHAGERHLERFVRVSRRWMRPPDVADEEHVASSSLVPFLDDVQVHHRSLQLIVRNERDGTPSSSSGITP